jgi:Saxitoxin biosynthesis operon protein SxtJ
LAERVPARLSPREGRRFGLLVGGAFLALGGLLWWRGHGAGAWVGFGLGTVLLIAGLAIPGRLGPVHRAWMGVSLAVSKVTTPVFMSVVYFLVLTPAGFLMRLLGRNPLARDHKHTTFWATREGGPRSDMQRQF